MIRQPFTLLLHIALAIILAGAIVTHYAGIQGELELMDGAAPVKTFKKTSGPGDGSFPFEVSLVNADVTFYPGTTTPMDFHSCLSVDGMRVNVSMNKVAKVEGWRFFQSGMDADGSTLSVSHDPWGTGITYTGYMLLGIGMVGFFFQKRTAWRSLLRKRAALMLFVMALGGGVASASSLPTMQKPLAANLGKVYVYWNDRVCPMQTMACDVAAKLYGSRSYQGYTPEQILSGWLFYFDEWQRDYAKNFTPEQGASQKTLKEFAEKEALVNWLGTGEAFRIYPYHTRAGHMEWLSLSGRKPSAMPFEQWRFMQTTMPDIKASLLVGKNIHANEIITTLIDGQREYAGVDNLPSDAKMRAERFYNRWARPLPVAIVALLAAIFWLYAGIANRKDPRGWNLAVGVVASCSFVCLLAILALVWWIGGHAPLSNGPEIMLFMGAIGMAGALAVKSKMLKGGLMCVAAMTLFVASMGGSTPRIGMLMPVLASPLLSVHVAIVMTSYVLFLLMAVLSAIALWGKNPERAQKLSRYNRIILLPAVFLLAAGIFIGAVWANQSWGRYWGWDPKETCALVMLFVYSVPLHWASRWLRCFRRPKVLHIYLLLAVLTVLFTYFGANYLIPGLHSYA